MGFFGSFTGSDQRKDMKRGYAESNQMLDDGYGQARGEINTGYDTADRQFGQARGDLRQGYQGADAALTQGFNAARTQLNPYTQGGAGANALLRRALGIDGAASQQSFMQNYAGSDPFRDSNADFATNALMRAFNARGMSGTGTAAAAVAQENLRRGSQDYNSYLDRLTGMSNQGMSAGNSLAQLAMNYGNNRANNLTGLGTGLANISQNQGTNAVNRGTTLGGLSTDLATTKAGNRINLANSLANSRGILGNNLMKVAEIGVKAAAGMG